MSTKVQTYRYDPACYGPVPADGSADAHPFEYLTVETGGTPTVAKVTNKWRLALDNTNEVQAATLRMADGVLPFDIDDILRFRVWAALSVALGAAAKIKIGLGDDTQTDMDTVSPAVLFGATGTAGAVTVEARDGTNTLAATAVGLNLSTTVKKFSFNFAEGIHAQGSPDASLGGKAKILAGVDNDYGEHQRVNDVLGSSRINLGAYTGNLMPVVQLQKTASTDLGTLDIYGFEFDVRVPN